MDHCRIALHTVADRIDREVVLGGYRIVQAAVLEELHTVLHRTIAMDDDPGEHRNHHAAAGMMNDWGEDQEGRRIVLRHRVAVVDMEVALEVGTVGRSLAEDIRNSCLMFENLEST